MFHAHLLPCFGAACLPDTGVGLAMLFSGWACLTQAWVKHTQPQRALPVTGLCLQTNLPQNKAEGVHEKWLVENNSFKATFLETALKAIFFWGLVWPRPGSNKPSRNACKYVSGFCFSCKNSNENRKHYWKSDFHSSFSSKNKTQTHICMHSCWVCLTQAWVTLNPHPPKKKFSLSVLFPKKWP